MEGKTVNPKKGQSRAKNGSKVTSSVSNQCLKSSAGSPLAVEKETGSIAPLRAELWPFKEGTRQFYPKIEANVTDFGNPFSNAYISGLEWSFAKIQKPQIISWALASHRKRIQVNCTSGSRAVAVQRGQQSEEFL